jgi:glycosyltransferase involved in cell wall biosynthesis
VPDNHGSTVDSKPLRVLHVLEATLGGTLRYMENIAEATEGLGLVSGFAYGTARADSRLKPFLECISTRGWSSYPVDMARQVQPLHDLKACFRLRQVIAHFTPDIIHCHSSKAGALGRVAVFLKRDRPARVYSPHALAAPLGSIYLKIEKLLSKSTDRFVAVSDSERREIINFSLARESSVSVVYPSVDSGYFQPMSRNVARQILGFGSTPLVLAIGRLTPQKDPASFLRIIKSVHDQQPDVRAIWVGSGEGEREFHDQVRAANMEQVVRLVPWQNDVRTYIAAADVFLSTSRFESFGYVTAEALAMTRPVVASDVTGTLDIMSDRFTEWLYPQSRADLAADLVLRLLRDPLAAVAIGNLGRREVERRFSTERMRDSLIGAYHSALGRPYVELNPQIVAA